MMQRSERNRLFEEKSPLIDQTMGAHNQLIQGYRLCRDDVRQELALRMLECLDRYDPGLCPNLDAWLVKQLRYALLHQTAPSKRFGIPNAPRSWDFHVLTLDDGRLDVAYTENPEEYIIVRDEIARLPSPQRSALCRAVLGNRILCSNKTLRSARLRLRRKIESNDIRKKE